ncbi:AbrB/MazE/SpoVT family DNA-binding domain-containing protein [Methylobacterium sp. E-005]|uniref:AbrB/MazE/SpoVT family DNA-binding domain-containing protein n=1 Tax=Methylobacterium sp. E-005 TaxID=2836549 RepID=UPI001FB99727|nr:AbrB/MazE/SpoVT family DNA-binding domain-containing protein [Methylobacterium sp. E-005]MCJ2086021.1 AbrB/MazE/SpoVT family DNA-binding domain-containing protein [Methylobacterium sp. E-005]
MTFVTDVKLAANGRMVLPQAVREAMGISGETRIIVTVDGTDVRLSPIANIVTKLQALYREHVKEDADSASFLNERHADDSDAVAAKA